MADAQSTILIVDDDADDLASVERALRSLGANLVKVRDPHEVLPTVERVRPDVVVLDALLPGLSGFDLCKEIKSSSELRTTQVLIVTAVYLRQQYRQEALQQFKADAFLTKPFRPPELQRIVVQLLSRKTRKPQSGLLKRLGLPASAKSEKRTLLGRLFSKGEDAAATARIAPPPGRRRPAEPPEPSEERPSDGAAEAQETMAAVETPRGAIALPATLEEAPPSNESETSTEAPEPEPSAEPEPAHEEPPIESASPEASSIHEKPPTLPFPDPAEVQASPAPTEVVSSVEPTPAPEPESPPEEPAPEPVTELSPESVSEALPELVAEPQPEPEPTPVETPAPEENADIAESPAAKREHEATDVEEAHRAVEAGLADDDEPEEISAAEALESTPELEDELEWREVEPPAAGEPKTIPAVDIPESLKAAATAEALDSTSKPSAKPRRKRRAKRMPENDGGSPLEAAEAPAAPPPPEPVERPTRRPPRRVGEVPIYEEEEFEAELKRELSKCRRVDRPLTLILIQVSDLDQIVELFGKQLREEVLWHVAEQAMGSLREVDLVGMLASTERVAMTAFASDRYGGGRIVSRMRRTVGKNPIKVGEELPPIVPALSFGMASYPEDADEVETLLARAEEDVHAANARQD